MFVLKTFRLSQASAKHLRTVSTQALPTLTLFTKVTHSLRWTLYPDLVSISLGGDKARFCHLKALVKSCFFFFVEFRSCLHALGSILQNNAVTKQRSVSTGPVFSMWRSKRSSGSCQTQSEALDSFPTHLCSPFCVARCCFVNNGYTKCAVVKPLTVSR